MCNLEVVNDDADILGHVEVSDLKQQRVAQHGSATGPVDLYIQAN